MSMVGGGASTSKGLVDRVRNILLKPKTEWAVIELEPATARSLYVGYACILAAITPVCGLIGGQVFGHGVLGIVYRPPLITALVGAVVGYVMSLIMVFVMALIIDALAPSFDGQKSQIQALKVAVYAYTASWVAGVFGLLPPLLPLVIIAGLYGLYLLYLGLPRLMKVPQEKALGYTVVTIIVAVVLGIVIGLVTAAVVGMSAVSVGGLASIGGHDAGTISGTLTAPGVGSVDLGKLQAASKQMEVAAKHMEAASVVTASAAASDGGTAAHVVPAEALQAMLPMAVAGYARGDVSSQSGGVAGMSGASAEGHYARGASTLTLEVTDLGTMSGLAAFGGALNVNSTNRSATGYEKVGKVNGRMTTEEWDGQAKTGKYGVVVADRFMVEADGSGTSMDELKGAVAAVDFGKLESLART